MKKYLLISLLLTMLPMVSKAQAERKSHESVKVFFRLGETKLDLQYKDNGSSLRKYADAVNACRRDSLANFRKIRILASTSPEGTDQANERVARKRAQSIVDWVNQEFSEQLEYTVESMDTDWETLVSLVEQTPRVPYQEEVLHLLRNTPVSVIDKGQKVNERFNRLLKLRGGVPYRWMFEHLFPQLRYGVAEVEIWWEAKPQPQPEEEPVVVEDTVKVTPEVLPQPMIPEPVPEPAPEPQEEVKPFYMAVKTNLLYDVAFVPNIGAEIYLGKNWSLAGNWQYIWLSNKAKHKYWRIGAGDVALRRWFGKKALQKPLTGHHAGVYAQMMTYDFAPTGDEGIIAEDYNWSIGVEYGYSLPIARRLNIDFTLGVGYHWGEYKKYIPIDDHSVWQSTKQRRYFGPTKAEISLVWLIGRGNYNKKGGQQ